MKHGCRDIGIAKSTTVIIAQLETMKHGCRDIGIAKSTTVIIAQLL